MKFILFLVLTLVLSACSAQDPLAVPPAEEGVPAAVTEEADAEDDADEDAPDEAGALSTEGGADRIDDEDDEDAGAEPGDAAIGGDEEDDDEDEDSPDEAGA